MPTRLAKKYLKNRYITVYKATQNVKYLSLFIGFFNRGKNVLQRMDSHKFYKEQSRKHKTTYRNNNTLQTYKSEQGHIATFLLVVSPTNINYSSTPFKEIVNWTPEPLPVPFTHDADRDAPERSLSTWWCRRRVRWLPFAHAQ